MAIHRAIGRIRQVEAERPFWISFSDLMTALMVLFLIAMSVAFHAVRTGVDKQLGLEKNRRDSIGFCMDELQEATKRISGATVREHSIDFGPRASFQMGRNDLTQQQISVLRAFVPRVVAITQDSACKPWLKHIVVDGFASREGTYLHNLDLSIERSERVLCVLLDPYAADAPSEADRRLIQKLFFVGGSSFNSLKEHPAESRRIELKLEFYELKEPRDDTTGEIALGADATCPVDQR